MAGYIGSKAVLLSTTAATVTGDAEIAGGLTVDTNTLVVDSTNNRVGIGTAAPSQPLTVEKTSNPKIRSTYTGGANLDMVAGATSGYFGTQTNHGLALFTNDTTRMTIDSSGNVLVGKTSFLNSGAGHLFSTEGVDGAVHRLTRANNTGGQSHIRFFRYDGTGIGGITTTNTATQYVTTSDYRLKEDVQPMTGASERVLALKPCNFAWKADGTRVDGFLAHELQEVVPEAATGAKDAVDEDGKPIYQGIDQSKLVPLLTAALQEALTEIAALKDRVAALEAN